MDLTQLANLGEFIGGAVVVISLVYLALQAKQSARQQRSENYGRSLDRASSMMSAWAKDPSLNQLVIDGTISIEKLTPSDRVRFGWQMNEIFGTYEFVFEQNGLRVLPDHVWERYSRHLGFWVSLPGVRTWWANNPGFSEAFTRNVDARLSDAGLSADETAAFWGQD